MTTAPRYAAVTTATSAKNWPDLPQGTQPSGTRPIGGKEHTPSPLKNPFAPSSDRPERRTTLFGHEAVVLENPTTTVFQGDCREVMSDIADEYGGRVRLVFADPPFAIGQVYKDFRDQMSRDQYLRFSHDWLQKAAKLLTPSGILCLNIPDQWALELGHFMKRELKLLQEEWICWHYRFGQCGRTRFINSKVHCLVFRRPGPERKFNSADILVPSDRATKYADPRTRESQTPGERVPFDIWGIPSDGEFWGRIQGNNAERRKDHPNQLPEKYLERVIRAFTDPGDLIVDPFAGSGTTAVVARALMRPSITIEISKPYVESVVDRLKTGAVRVKPLITDNRESA